MRRTERRVNPKHRKLDSLCERLIPSQGLGESRPQGDGQGAPTEVCLVSGLPASSGAHGQARPIIVELPDSKE